MVNIYIECFVMFREILEYTQNTYFITLTLTGMSFGLGLWLGVEWDEPDRGKHDGSHDGVQYFSCR